MKSFPKKTREFKSRLNSRENNKRCPDKPTPIHYQGRGG